MELYNTAEAKRFLSLDGKPMGDTTFEYHIKRNRIKPDFKSGRKRYFHKETLEVIKRQIRDEENYTLKEIANRVLDEMWQSIPYYLIHYHFTEKRTFEPAGKRGHAKTYSPEAIMMVVKSEGWQLSELGIRELSQRDLHVEPE